jgi:hypothetical protein
MDKVQKTSNSEHYTPLQGFVAGCHIRSLQNSMGYAYGNIKDLIEYNTHKYSATDAKLPITARKSIS